EIGVNELILIEPLEQTSFRMFDRTFLLSDFQDPHILDMIFLLLKHRFHQLKLKERSEPHKVTEMREMKEEFEIFLGAMSHALHSLSNHDAFVPSLISGIEHFFGSLGMD